MTSCEACSMLHRYHATFNDFYKIFAHWSHNCRVKMLLQVQITYHFSPDPNCMENTKNCAKIVQNYVRIHWKSYSVTYWHSRWPSIMQASFNIPQCHTSIPWCCFISWQCLVNFHANIFIMVHCKWILSMLKTYFLSCEDQILCKIMWC